MWQYFRMTRRWCLINHFQFLRCLILYTAFKRIAPTNLFSFYNRMKLIANCLQLSEAAKSLKPLFNAQAESFGKYLFGLFSQRLSNHKSKYLRTKWTQRQAPFERNEKMRRVERSWGEVGSNNRKNVCSISVDGCCCLNDSIFHMIISNLCTL